MIVGVMQPYLFPYLGYYQLVKHADAFVFYDDVNYIVRGYINRNNILLQGKSHRVTLPVISASQNSRINELKYSSSTCKFLRTLQHAYGKAPFFQEVYPLVESIVTDPERNVANICSNSVAGVYEYLGIQKRFERSSALEYDRSNLNAAEKLAEISRMLGADTYCNSAGGRKLYRKDYFKELGIALQFITMNDDVVYPQACENFVANLSIIDVLMWCPKSDVRDMLHQFTID